MSDPGANLGKATLILEADLSKFTRNIEEGRGQSDRMQGSLDAIARVARVAEIELSRVKMDARSGTDSAAIADRIERSVGSVGRAAMEASQHLQEVKLTSAQAAESDASGDVIDRKLKDITGNANEARRSLESVRLASAGNPGVGVGPFGSGFGRIGLLGAGIGAGVLTGPAAGPAVAGLAAAIPAFAATGVGVLGTLALAFDGVSKAIGGDKKAFDGLQPSAQQFVQTIRSLTGWVDQLKQTAGSAMFPGLTEGLKAALSPGTVDQITAAVREFGVAIGQAGAAWGRYFGSAEFQSIFGPLMAAGARNLGALSSAALSLFDALGVLARAAIPLTTWLSNAANSGAKLADNWLHAKDASGALAGAMGEAQTSLRLVGGLIESLGKAIGALGIALYPVSKIAVKDLTDGLNSLSRIISDNRGEIQEIVGGALAALVSTLKLLKGIVADLWPLVDRLASGLGGWKQVFEALIGLKIASLVAGWAASFVKLASMGALGGAELKAGGLLANMNKLKLLGPIALVVTLDLIPKSSLGKSALDSIGLGALAKVPVLGGLFTQSAALGEDIRGKLGMSTIPDPSKLSPLAAKEQANERAGIPSPGGKVTTQQIGAMLKAAGYDSTAILGVASNEGLSGGIGDGGHAFGPFQLNNAGGVITGMFPGWTNAMIQQWAWSPAGVQWAIQKATASGAGKGLTGAAAVQAWVKNFERPKDPTGDINAGLAALGATGGASGYDTSVFGADPVWSKNTGQPTAKQKAASAARALAAKLQIPVTHAQTLVAHYKTLAAAADTGPAIARYLDDEVGALKKENVALKTSMEGKSAAQKAKIQKQIGANEDTITKIHASIVQALDMKREAGLFSQFMSKLATSTAKLNTDTARASILSGTYLDAQHKAILDDAEGQAAMLAREKNILSAELKTATGKFATQVRGQLSTVTSKLASIQQTVVQSLAQMVQDAQAAFTSKLSALQTAADAQMQASLAATVAKLGVQFFQGGGQTPLEKQLADMQAQDQLSSLQDAVSSATDDKARAAAQRQLDEYNLSIRATAERAQADKEYAAEVKRATDDEARRQANLDAGMQQYSDQMLNTGHSTVSLGALFDAAGVSVAELALLPGSPFDALNTAAGALTAAFLAYASKLGGGSSTSTAPYSSPGSQARAGIGTGGALGSSTLAAQYARAVAAIGVTLPPDVHIPGIPSLDVGGQVVQSGLAMVHRGEFFTGVHGEALAGGGDIVLKVGEREFGRIAASSIAKDRGSRHVLTKAVKPELAKVVSV